MFACNFCPLQFNTEPEFNVHNEKCREDVQSPPKLSSSQLNMRNFCDKSFKTAGELDAHACKGNDRIMLLCLTQLMKSVVEFIKKRPMKNLKTLGQCHYCLQDLYTVDEVVEHRNTCMVLQMENIIEVIYKSFKKMIGEIVDEPVTMTPMSSSSPKQSKSQEFEQTTSSRKRALDTDNEIDPATQSESNTETSSPPSKICRSSDKDIIDIETGQKSATDSKICDSEKETSAKKTFDCAFCDRKFQSLNELRPHIIQCCE